MAMMDETGLELLPPVHRSILMGVPSSTSLNSSSTSSMDLFMAECEGVRGRVNTGQRTLVECERYRKGDSKRKRVYMIGDWRSEEGT